MSDDNDAPAEVKKYRPAKGKRIPMPGNQGDWPQEGRPINPLSGWESRLVADGDLVLVTEKHVDAPASKPTARRKAKTAAIKPASSPTPPAATSAAPIIASAAETAAETLDIGGNQ